VGERRPRLRVESLDQPRRVRSGGREVVLPLREVLADRRVPAPLEHCRLDLDYPAILRRQKATRKARCVFAWLARTHGAGRQTELARDLRVSPPRIVQLKRQLARCLATEDYYPPPTRPSNSRRPQRGRRRRHAPPLNAGTSSAQGGHRLRLASYVGPSQPVQKGGASR
jgi:hypothetical protein